MNNYLLMASDLHLERGGQEILRGVTLEIAAGQVYGLLGRNGSGKSSLAYTLMGCAGYVPQQGRVFFDGQDIIRLSITERARLGLTLAWQEPARFEGLKVQDYLALGMREPSRTRMEEALEAVALSPSTYLNRPVNEALSGGERKRIELAAVYAMRPRLAILDEPDSGIDVLSLDDIGQLIRRMAGEGTSVLLITHRDEMVPVADAAALMCEGEIVRVGDPAEVRRHYAYHCRPCEVAASVEPPGGGYERL
ncbi:MAG: ABC transporter ATP-binding protein [Chloroflexi bacterium]|nr:ABC transporter ATP-binding protein [Chloroflexota bacterium]